MSHNIQIIIHHFLKLTQPSQLILIQACVCLLGGGSTNLTHMIIIHTFTVQNLQL